MPPPLSPSMCNPMCLLRQQLTKPTIHHQQPLHCSGTCFPSHSAVSAGAACPCPPRSPTPARAYSIHSVLLEDTSEVPWINLFLLTHSVRFADHKPFGTAAAVIQRHPESKAKGCCPYKASKRYRCLSPLLPRIQNVQSSRQPLCSPNRAATVPDILPRLFFAPAVPGRRCHLIVSLFLWCFGRKTEGFFFFFF